jgi:hypothetical protein
MAGESQTGSLKDDNGTHHDFLFVSIWILAHKKFLLRVSLRLRPRLLDALNALIFSRFISDLSSYLLATTRICLGTRLLCLRLLNLRVED